MENYEVIMSPDAITDIVDIKNYIADVLLAPEIALSYIRALRVGIGKLSIMPSRIHLVSNEPWRSKGIRKTIVKNFYIYFRIDEDNKRVYILNIIYSKRDQLRVLSKMKLD